jgi:membrane protein DedA with SNARE-associated domain
MNLRKFILYTAVGGSIWMCTLIFVGYVIGGNKELVHRYMPYITGACLSAVFLLVIIYIARKRKKIEESTDGVA